MLITSVVTMETKTWEEVSTGKKNKSDREKQKTLVQLYVSQKWTGEVPLQWQRVKFGLGLVSLFPGKQTVKSLLFFLRPLSWVIICSQLFWQQTKLLVNGLPINKKKKVVIDKLIND